MTVPIPGQLEVTAIEKVRALAEKAAPEDAAAVQEVLARLVVLEVKTAGIELAEALAVVKDAAQVNDRLGKALRVVLAEYDRLGAPPAAEPKTVEVPRRRARSTS